MATRSGDLDPGIAAHLARTEGMSAQRFCAMANHESGLLGISETSGDMRDLLAAEATDRRAADAVGPFCYQAKKWIGAYAAALGGVGTLVFAGGVGESAALVRWCASASAAASNFSALSWTRPAMPRTPP